MTIYRHIGTLKQIFGSISWPMEFIHVENLPDFLEKVHVLDYKFRPLQYGMQFDCWLAIKEELKLSIPGLDAVELILGVDDLEGITIFKFSADIQEDYSLVLHNMGLAFRFDETILKPVSLNGTPTPLSTEIQFSGTVAIDSQFNLDFIGFDSISLPLSEIGDTGIIISAQDVKFDFSRTSSLPEITASGFDVSFLGFYIENAQLLFPELEQLTPPDLNVSKAAMGSGGFSGEVSLDQTQDPYYEAILSGGIVIQLHQFDLVFRQNNIDSSLIQGFIFIPGVADNTGQDALIALSASIANKTYSFNAMAASGVSLGPLPLSLQAFSFVYDPSGLNAFSVAGTMQIPGIKDASGQNDVNFDCLLEYDQGQYGLQVTGQNGIKLGSLELNLQDFSIDFDQNGLDRFSINGQLFIPGIKENDNSNEAEFQLSLSYDNALKRFEASVAGKANLKIAGLIIDILGFGFQIQNGQLLGLAISAILKLPGLKDQQNNSPAEIAVTLSFTNNGFSLLADTAQGIFLSMGEVEITFFSFGITIENGSIQQSNIAGKLKIPGLQAETGNQDAEIDILLQFQGNTMTIAAASIGTGIKVKLGNLEITLVQFSISFDNNGIIGSSISGTMKLPNVKDANGQDAVLDISMAISENGFDIEASNSAGIELQIPKVIGFTLYRLGIGRINGHWYINISLDAELESDIPVINKMVPDKVSIVALHLQQQSQLLFDDITISWPDGLEVGSDAQNSLQLSIPIQQKILEIIYLDFIHLNLKSQQNVTSTELLISGSLSLTGNDDSDEESGKGFVAVVDKMGVKADFNLASSGQGLGSLKTNFAFVPPKSIGIVINASAVKGGGFLSYDPDKGEYAGVAELTIRETVSVKAVVIISSKLPNGRKRTALLILITAEFTPIQLGYGFTLNGVGGLIAIHRSMNLDALRDGVRTNAIDSIMFPDNPVAEAPRIIADLNNFFPLTEDQYSFGLMAIIGWGTPTIISIELGLMIQIPNPIRIAILGVVKLILPKEEPKILALQVNFIGTLDFERKFISFDASLYQSSLLNFTLEGDMAFRLKYGDKPNFLFTAGGFHPEFEPPALSLPALRRMTINLLREDNPRLTLSSYFAVTSNTVQFGASIDFYYRVSKKWKITVVGHLGFDTLFQFSPFYVLISISASLSVKRRSKTLMGVSLSGFLEGPTPWHAKGTGKFKVLGIKFKVKFDKTFGKRETTTLPDIEVASILLPILKDGRSWTAMIPANSEILVTFRKLETAEVILFPAGRLSVNQTEIPLDKKLSRVGQRKVKGYKKFSIKLNNSLGNEMTTSPIKDYFAPVQFFEVSNKVGRKSFEQYNSGLSGKGDNDFNSDDYVEKQVEYERMVIDGAHQTEKTRSRAQKHQFNQWRKQNRVARSGRGKKAINKREAFKQIVKLQEESFIINQKADLKPYANFEASSQTEAILELEKIIENNPALEGKLQVMPAYELV